jgi:hypothetical protein
MRALALSALSVVALASCSPPVPDSAAGVGLPAAAPVSAAPLDGSPATGPEAIAADTAAALGTSSQANGAPLSAMAADASTATPAAATDASGQPVADGTQVVPQLSDEQNFAAVKQRETIQSDAERLAANRAQYTIVEPTALPPRPNGTGASVVAYALATTNAPGQPLYPRSGHESQSRYQAACARYDGEDRAQEAFLDAGGPKRDRYGLDPDGDGFACYWDPRPFRAARTAAVPQASATASASGTATGTN